MEGRPPLRWGPNAKGGATAKDHMSKKPPKSNDVVDGRAGEFVSLLLPDVDVRAQSISDFSRSLATLVDDDRRNVVSWYRSNISVLMDSLEAERMPCPFCGAPVWWVDPKFGRPFSVDRDGIPHKDCAG